MPASWVTRDIGAVTPAGTADATSQTAFKLAGGGPDIGGTSDQFRFVYQIVTGDVDVVARVDSILSNSLAPKAGVMIRSALTPEASHAFAAVASDRGVAFERRKQTGGGSTSTPGDPRRTPQWLRLVRMGTSVTAMSSIDGQSWVTVATDTVAIEATAYVGIAVTSRAAGMLAFADVSNVSVVPVALPAGQQSADVGAPAVRGSTTYLQGVYAVTGAGTDNGTADQIQYVFQQVQGDVEILARTISLTNVNEWTRAGVMVRESLASNARYAFTAVTATHGYAFQRRIDAGGFSEHTDGGPNAMPSWIRLVRSGSSFEAFRSVDGRTWVSFGRDTVPMGESVYVGLAVTSHAPARAATAVIDSVEIRRAPTTTNRPPIVALTSPASGARFTSPASFDVTATASDPENRLARVDFYLGTTKIGSDAAAPFSMNLPAMGPGTYSFVAVAIDADGGIATSTPATIDVASAIAPAPAPAPQQPGPTPVPLPPPPPPPMTPTVPAAPTPTAPPPPAPAPEPAPSVPVAPPAVIVFTMSAGHYVVVQTYRLDVFPAGTVPGVVAPLATSDLGKPAPDAVGDITVDRTAFFSALKPGSYLATVTAIGLNGSSVEGRSIPVVLLR